MFGSRTAMRQHILLALSRYEFILTSGRPISRAEYQEVMGVEERTAQRHLKAFVERKLVKQNGSGRGTTYEAIIE